MDVNYSWLELKGPFHIVLAFNLDVQALDFLSSTQVIRDTELYCVKK
jgi:hypothetical protein